MEPRKLERRDTFAQEDILKLIDENDLSSYNTFLVLNGGTGLGKTSAVMSKVHIKLQEKFGSPQSMLVVESRSATVAQLQENYAEEIEHFQGIDICQRLGFMHMIEKNTANYNWVVIDECHGLFSEAGFAADAAYIANWIKNERTNTHIIFVTANDEYFDTLAKDFFPQNYNFIYLFPDFTKYYSNTYVKEIQFIKSNKTEAILTDVLARTKGQKGIIFIKQASKVRDYFFKFLAQGLRVGMIVSQGNTTIASLTNQQEKIFRDVLLDLSEGNLGTTMADLCEIYDRARKLQGLEGIREAIINERIPEDIDILLATDTIQEGISIKSIIHYIVIEGFTEVEVRQKLGRYRGNLNLLYILFNPTVEGTKLAYKARGFEQALRYIQQDNQVALAEMYGAQKILNSNSNFLFVLKQNNLNTGQVSYIINEPAYKNYKRDLEKYLYLQNNIEEAIKTLYGYPLCEGYPKLLSYDEDIKKANRHAILEEIVNKWRGIPLKGEQQELFIQDFIAHNITDKKRCQITTFRGCCAALNEENFILKTKKASKKDLINWPYLKEREEYKYIE